MPINKNKKRNQIFSQTLCPAEGRIFVSCPLGMTFKCGEQRDWIDISLIDSKYEETRVTFDDSMFTFFEVLSYERDKALKNMAKMNKAI